MLMELQYLVPPGVPECVDVQNPPGNSSSQHEEPGGSQDCEWALVPRATARKFPARDLVMLGRAT